MCSGSKKNPKTWVDGRLCKAYIDDMLEEIHGTCEKQVRYVGRKPSASTATGSARVHQAEQERLITRALEI